MAAFGRVVSGGTSTARSASAFARHASRQPAASSSGENARGSDVDTSTGPSIRTLHLRHVPCPPQVESMAMPCQLAASNTDTPAGTRTSRSFGVKEIRTLSVMVRRLRRRP